MSEDAGYHDLNKGFLPASPICADCGQPFKNGEIFVTGEDGTYGHLNGCPQSGQVSEWAAERYARIAEWASSFRDAHERIFPKSSAKPRLTAADIIMLREMKIKL